MLLIYMLLIAIFLEILFMFMVKEVFCFGIIILTFGFIFIACLYHDLAVNKNVVKIMAVFCMIWGSLVLLSPIISHSLDIDFLTEYIFIYGLGLMFILLGIYIGFVKIFFCNQKVSAEFIGVVPYRIRSFTHYTPQFKVRYDHRTYTNTTGEVYSKRKINKKFKIGEKYQVYIDPKKPQSICVKRSPSFSSLLMIIIGISLLMIC